MNRTRVANIDLLIRSPVIQEALRTVCTSTLLLTSSMAKHRFVYKIFIALHVEVLDIIYT